MKEYTQIFTDIGNASIVIRVYDGFFYPHIIENQSHSHSVHELHFAISGSSYTSVNEKLFFLSENDICLIPPGVIHSGLKASDNAVHSSFSFILIRKEENASVGNDVFSKFKTKLDAISKPTVLLNQKLIISYLSRILEEFHENNIYSLNKIKSLFALIFLELFQHLDEGNVMDRKNASRLTDNEIESDIRPLIIEDYMTRNFMRNISIDDLAKLLFVSHKQLNRLIEKYFNMSFQEYLIKSRINEAFSLLREGNLSNHEIAFRLGYSSYNGFYYIFKKVVGKSPNDFRKS